MKKFVAILSAMALMFAFVMQVGYEKPANADKDGKQNFGISDNPTPSRNNPDVWTQYY
ncbi:hypothetical protein JXA32_06670 [Candidatus Sumerlaeota bacterium]|nr:hypothetical protein [Candidatus Sumerlaeota bacterium]